MATKDIEIDFNGRKEIVKMRSLNFGERNQYEEECADMKIMGGQPFVKVSSSKMKELGLLKAIVDAPFTVSIQAIRELDPQTGQKLFEAFTELNQLQEVKKES